MAWRAEGRPKKKKINEVVFGQMTRAWAIDLLFQLFAVFLVGVVQRKISLFG